MDPAVLDHLDTVVPDNYPQVRSVLVVRHGYLVVERYWQGVEASDGHDVRSVTRASPRRWSAFALRDGKLKGLDQTVGELLADHLPANADPRLRQVTVEQLLTRPLGWQPTTPRWAVTTDCSTASWRAAIGCATSWAGGWRPAG